MSKSKPGPVGLPGVRARAIRGPRADGRWYWRAELSTGDSVGATVGTWWATAAEAGKLVAELVATGRARPSTGSSGASQISTVDELLRAHVAHLEDTRPDLAGASMKAYRLRVRQIREVGCGSYLLERLNASTMEAIRAALLRKPLAPRSVNSAIGQIGVAWSWGRREGIVPDRDLLVPTVAVKPTPKRTPTAEEIERVLGHITSPWARLLARLLWATGARIGEVAALTWADVELEVPVVRFRGKTGERLVPLTPEVAAELRAWRAWSSTADPSAPVLGVRFNSVRVNGPRRLAEACEAAGVPAFSPHAFRRAAVDAMARSGVDITTAAKLMGHTPEVMISYYRQVTDDDLRAAVEVLGRRAKQK